MKRAGALGLTIPAGSLLLNACSIGSDDDENGNGNGAANAGSTGLSASAQEIAEERGLTPDDINAALKTYVPSGQHDEYYMFASGGHSGQVLVLGLPSMRILKLIGVFTPEPWQGYGFSDETKNVLQNAQVSGKDITWGDTHHPALSETGGEYDGEFLFISDKAHARIAVIDLRDFETKQIIKNPHILSNHGGSFVTPDTEYIIDGSQYSTPMGWEYAPLSEFKEKYRGAMTFWKFDREAGRIIPEESFSIELPPYMQDLADAGKFVSDGWMFSNSFNVEMAIGGEGNPPMEAGASQLDMDYMSVINWRKAAEVAMGADIEEVKGMKFIPMDRAVEEDLLFQIPEPKSPHGVDVTPDGKFMVVSGKLDPHVTVYNFEKVMAAIDAGGWEFDEFGVPVLKFEDCMEVQVELGLGPLHTQYDDRGFAYTSLFLDSSIAKWKVGEEGKPETWEMIEKVPVQYNVGHLTVVEGDTISPKGKYLVALNKWAIDRFAPVGPLHPQNFQLIDISGDTMQVLYDAAIGVGEPHYAQTISADKINPWVVYPPGFDPGTMEESPVAIKAGEQSIERDGNKVTINMTSIRSHFKPDQIEVNEGDEVTWHITNIEQAQDATHAFALPAYDFNVSIEPGEVVTMSFVADVPGVFPCYCTEFCSALHLEMMCYFLVKPA